jgi:hypothetical protein
VFPLHFGHPARSFFLDFFIEIGVAVAEFIGVEDFLADIIFTNRRERLLHTDKDGQYASCNRHQHSGQDVLDPDHFVIHAGNVFPDESGRFMMCFSQFVTSYQFPQKPGSVF